MVTSLGGLMTGWLLSQAKPLINNKPNEQLEASNNKLKEAQAKIADLKTTITS